MEEILLKIKFLHFPLLCCFEERKNYFFFLFNDVIVVINRKKNCQCFSPAGLPPNWRGIVSQGYFFTSNMAAYNHLSVEIKKKATIMKNNNISFVPVSEFEWPTSTITSWNSLIFHKNASLAFGTVLRINVNDICFSIIYIFTKNYQKDNSFWTWLALSVWNNL